MTKSWKVLEDDSDANFPMAAPYGGSSDENDGALMAELGGDLDPDSATMPPGDDVSSAPTMYSEIAMTNKEKLFEAAFQEFKRGLAQAIHSVLQSPKPPRSQS